MTNHEYLQQARRDFIEAGPTGQYVCPASDADGEDRDGSLCVAFRANDTETRYGGDFLWLEDEWLQLIGESMPATNERGYEACVAAYDLLVSKLIPVQTTMTTTLQEVSA